MTALADSVQLPVTALAASGSTLAVARGPYVYTFDLGEASNTSLRRIDTFAESSPIENQLVRHVALPSSSTLSGPSSIAYVSEDKRLHIASLNDTSSETSATSWTLLKRASCLSFPSESAGTVLVSDKVGDCYLYPRASPVVPSTTDGTGVTAEAERPQTLKLHADPSLNPDADYLLGHTSVLTAHVLASSPPSGPAVKPRQYLITADRDEHIRVSRYPQSYVVERYLHGTEGFVSALHIPSGSEILVSGGGEGLLRIWSWQTGQQLGTVPIYEAVLPHRRVRSAVRKLRKGRRAVKSEDKEADPFLEVPEGWVLPSGRGVCVKNITSVQLGGQTVIVFFSEGCAAIHSFVLPRPSGPAESVSSPTVHTLSLPFPVLTFTPLPPTSSDSASNDPSSSTPRLLVSLDTAFSTIYTNPTGGSDRMTLLPSPSPATPPEQLLELALSPSGELALLPASDAPTATRLTAALRAEEAGAAGRGPDQGPGQGLVTRAQLGRMQLYGDLALLPRWSGMEEDDELAGPPEEAVSGPGGAGPAAPGREAAPVRTGAGPKKRKAALVPSAADLARLSLRELGRLKAQGVDVSEEMRRKKKAGKAGTGAGVAAVAEKGDTDEPMSQE